MKYIRVVSYIFLAILVFSCTPHPKKQKPEKFDGAKLYSLINNALWGSEESNFKLSGLVNRDIPTPGNFNKFLIDSIHVKNKTLYSVMIEYENPLYNILAVYDDELNLYLLDTSLNGNFTVEWKKFGGVNYLIAYERFISKDILTLDRISLYKLTGSTMKMVYRGFSRFEKGNKVYSQTVTEINNNFITTRLSGNNRIFRKTKVDTFYYNKLDKKFESSKDVFNKFVLSEIKNGKWKIKKPQLTIETSDLKRNKDKTVTSEKLKQTLKGYQIELGSDWKVLKDLTISGHLKKKFKGTRFLNEKLGAQITIIKIPGNLTAEKYLKYKLGKETKGDYKVRSSELIKSGKNYLQFFEHSCGNKRFLLIIEAPKSTYETNKKIYDDIQTSFFIEC